MHQLLLISEAGGRCERCQETYHPFVYDFHHRDPRNKVFSLDRSVYGRSIKALRAEARKCHLLCANCHREVHTFNDTNFLVVSGVPVEPVEEIYVKQAIGFDL